MNADGGRYWDVTLGWKPSPGEIGCWAEVGAHIAADNQCPTAETAVALCREWRGIESNVVLWSISVVLRGECP